MILFVKAEHSFGRWNRCRARGLWPKVRLRTASRGRLLKIHDDARNGDILGVAGELASGVAINALERTSRQTALHCVCEMPDARAAMIFFLLEKGAAVTIDVFKAAVQTGSLETIKSLLQAGASIDEREDGHCGTLTIAAYGRTGPGDAALIPVLKCLLENGASPDIVSSYGESALSVTSGWGRFDAVRFLLDNGADPKPLDWTDLMRAVAFGTIADVKALLQQDSSLTERDFCERTPWLLSLQSGDIDKAKLLLAAGADRTDTGHCGRHPLLFAVEANRPDLLKWLLSEGFDVDTVDEFGASALRTAVESGYADCVALLLDAGADLDRAVAYEERPMKAASDVTVARLLMAAGEDLSDASVEVRRALTRVKGGDVRATREEYEQGRFREFGRSNPEQMDVPFWRAMVHSGCNAYHARTAFGDTTGLQRPVWCYDRFGRTTTLLPDGRIVEIAGEHEDWYDPDFCIYNDVVVFDGKGGFEIFGYPEKLFPPTDFHTATLVGEYLYLIGSVGYKVPKRRGNTPVYRLHCRSFQIDQVTTGGEKPGWVSEHRALYDAEADRICISGGKIMAKDFGPNPWNYALDLKRFRWVRLE